MRVPQTKASAHPHPEAKTTRSLQMKPPPQAGHLPLEPGHLSVHADNGLPLKHLDMRPIYHLSAWHIEYVHNIEVWGRLLKSIVKRWLALLEATLTDQHLPEQRPHLFPSANRKNKSKGTQLTILAHRQFVSTRLQAI
jgi:hypothetical protein